MKFIKKHIEAIVILLVIAVTFGTWQGTAVIEEYYRHKAMIRIYDTLEVLEETNRYLKFREEGKTRDVTIIFSDVLEGRSVPVIDLGDINLEDVIVE